MTWTSPLYEPMRINAAGKALAMGTESDDDLDVINNWRSCHSYPLQIIKMVLLRRATRVEKTSLVAQRLKRLPSTKAKLVRESTMRLTQMQDIGGCRAIMSSISGVKKLKRIFLRSVAKNPKGRHTLIKINDYIEHPKADGYRSIHFVYEYCSKARNTRKFNGQRIEVQLRTTLQHAWATAVETVDAVTGQALKTSLKSNIGDAKWRRLFVLMGSEISFRENQPLVPGSPESRDHLKKELTSLAKELNVIRILDSLGRAIKILGDKPMKNAVAYILTLNAKETTISLNYFTKIQMTAAEVAYARLEKANENNPHIQIVKVSVESINDLHKAYPNYYLDTTKFISALKEAIA